MLTNGVMVAESVGAAANLKTAVTGALDLAGTCVTFCLDNPVLAIGVGAGIASIAFGLFRKAKKSAR